MAHLAYVVVSHQTCKSNRSPELIFCDVAPIQSGGGVSRSEPVSLCPLSHEIWDSRQAATATWAAVVAYDPVSATMCFENRDKGTSRVACDGDSCSHASHVRGPLICRSRGAHERSDLCRG